MADELVVPPSPTADEFVKVLKPFGTHWFDIGVYLGASTEKLKEIRKVYTSDGVVTCLAELHDCLAQTGKLTWENIATVLRELDNHTLADSIHSNYILPAIRRTSSNETTSPPKKKRKTCTTVQHVPVAPSPTIDSQVVMKRHDLIDEVGEEFQSLSERLDILISKIWLCFESATNINIPIMQGLIERQCGLPPLPENEATVGAVFSRFQKQFSILKFRPLMFIVDTFLSNEEALKTDLGNLKSAVDSFKKSAKMVDLVSLNQHIGDDQSKVKLKLRNFWHDFTMKQFEVIMEKILDKLYELLSHITVDEGCICVSWNIPPSVDYTKLLPKLSLEFLQIIGVISLHIGDDVIYNVGEEGCQTLEAAMLQAIELKNTRAIELLLAVGCSPEVGTYNGDHAVTNVVNIRERSVDDGRGGGMNHVCVLGHNEHIEAIIDPNRVPECAACIIKEKHIKQLHMQVERKDHEEIQELMKRLNEKDAELMEQLKFKDDDEVDDSTEQLLRSQIAESASLNSALTEQIKSKDAAFIALMKEKEQLREELNRLKLEVKKEEDKKSLSVSPCTAVLPRQRLLGIGAEMKVKVITRNSDGKQLTNGGSAVRASLTCNKEECLVTDNGDGTYLVSVVPQQLGQHHLSITVNGGHIKDSPFTLNIVPQRDYTQLKEPSQIISGIRDPRFIAFSDNGDMFVTSCNDCIYVYDKSGNRKATIGVWGTGKQQFQSPHGIDISNGVVYVDEYAGHRIRMLTTGGEFIGTFGEKGSGIGQFNCPRDIKISPDGRVYVVDTFNDRVQVFNPDWTISHVIDSSSVPDGVRFYRPMAIAFDLSGDVHVTISSVTVFTPIGQFVRRYGGSPHYGGSKLHNARGIAIDLSGYSWVTSWNNRTLSVYDPSGGLVHSIGGFNHPNGVSVSPDGSVWVVDTDNKRLVKYN